MQETSLSESASEATSEGDGEATQSVCDSEGSRLSNWESVADSKGEGNCGNHKRVAGGWAYHRG